MKQQFNVNLSPELIRAVKHRSIDDQLSLSDWVERALGDHVKGDPVSQSDPAVDVVLQPMVHVRDMTSTVALLEVLGGQVRMGSRDGDWVQMTIGGAEIGLLAHPPNPDQNEGDVELNFSSRTPLEQVEAAARTAGVTIASPTSDEGFGRQLQLRTADGLLVKVNEIEPDLIR